MNLLPEMSDKSDVILKLLMAAKKEMGSRVRKDATNPFHKSKYASLGAHLEVCDEFLFGHGLVLVQTVSCDGDKYVLVTRLSNPESGQWIKNYMPLINAKNDCQGLGSAVTYMRRYSINSMLGLCAEDDDGESSCVREKTESKKTTPLPQKINNLQSGYLMKLESTLEKSYKDMMGEWLQNQFKVNSYGDVLDRDYEVVKGKLEAANKYSESQKLKGVANA